MVSVGVCGSRHLPEATLYSGSRFKDALIEDFSPYATLGFLPLPPPPPPPFPFSLPLPLPLPLTPARPLSPLFLFGESGKASFFPGNCPTTLTLPSGKGPTNRVTRGSMALSSLFTSVVLSASPATSLPSSSQHSKPQAWLILPRCRETRVIFT
ncbi:hypothetical protein E2C01_020638 [Portunus trituberculatus]|uniref:Uncharacterized protein n=1 Tax=Portunus trituberculatus TaxID=210409 RepID=A0A5B7E121_PORTR|nr:hypothetical protein [Portunus trituberculatus]